MESALFDLLEILGQNKKKGALHSILLRQYDAGTH
jgi:hypothetical protein